MSRTGIIREKIMTISPVEYNRNNYIDTIYNYFEDSFAENAGFVANESRVYSNKVGYKHFDYVMCAAYVLQGLYSDGDFITIDDTEPIIEDEVDYIKWINGLFDEHYSWKNWDIIKILGLIDEDDIDFDRFDIFDIDDIPIQYGYLPCLAWFEMSVVKCGMDEIKDDIYFKVLFEDLLNTALMNREAVDAFHKNNKESNEQQIEKLISIINQFLHEDFDISKEENEYIIKFFNTLYSMNSPNIALQSISEVYGIDFWILYHQLDHHERIHMQGIDDSIHEVHSYQLTNSFYKNDENRLYLWKENQEIPSHLKKWFQELRELFEKYRLETLYINNPYLWIVDMLEYAEDNYHHIYAFTSFFEESFEHINDQKYLILWKIFEDMIYDQTMYKNGGVIYESEEKVYDSWHHVYKRPLIDSWSIMDADKKWNSSRLKLRGYLGLVANKPLRKKVFGF